MFVTCTIDNICNKCYPVLYRHSMCSFTRRWWRWWSPCPYSANPFITPLDIHLAFTPTVRVSVITSSWHNQWLYSMVWYHRLLQLKFQKCSLIPRLPCSGTQMCICEESLVSFLCEHDVIKVGPEQKGNILRGVQPTMHSTLGVCDIWPPIARYV